MYIHFFNDRQQSAQQTNQQKAPSDIILGPVEVSWTYGNVRVHTNNWEDFEDLPFSKEGDLVQIEGRLYKNFQILEDNDPRLEEHYNAGKPFITWEQLFKRDTERQTHPLSFENSKITTLYIYFYHGRKNPHQQMNSWGDNGPILGPVQISWSNGNFKIHSGDKKDPFLSLPLSEREDLVHIKRMYYGDFEIWSHKDPLLEEHRKSSTPFITWDEFAKLNPEKQTAA